jgi:hypothetical protein
VGRQVRPSVPSYIIFHLLIPFALKMCLFMLLTLLHPTNFFFLPFSVIIYLNIFSFYIPSFTFFFHIFILYILFAQFSFLFSLNILYFNLFCIAIFLSFCSFQFSSFSHLVRKFKILIQTACYKGWPLSLFDYYTFYSWDSYTPKASQQHKSVKDKQVFNCK